MRKTRKIFALASMLVFLITMVLGPSASMVMAEPVLPQPSNVTLTPAAIAPGADLEFTFALPDQTNTLYAGVASTGPTPGPVTGIAEATFNSSDELYHIQWTEFINEPGVYSVLFYAESPVDGLWINTPPVATGTFTVGSSGGGGGSAPDLFLPYEGEDAAFCFPADQEIFVLDYIDVSVASDLYEQYGWNITFSIYDSVSGDNLVASSTTIDYFNKNRLDENAPYYYMLTGIHMQTSSANGLEPGIYYLAANMGDTQSNRVVVEALGGPVLSSGVKPWIYPAGIQSLLLHLNGYNLTENINALTASLKLISGYDQNSFPILEDVPVDSWVAAGLGIDPNSPTGEDNISITFTLPVASPLAEGDYILQLNYNGKPVESLSGIGLDFQVTAEPFLVEAEPFQAGPGETVKVYGENLGSYTYTVYMYPLGGSEGIEAATALSATSLGGRQYLEFQLPSDIAASLYSLYAVYTVESTDFSTLNEQYITVVSSTQASSDTTITSSLYTIDLANKKIANVPSGTGKSTFLSNIAKGQTGQNWNDTAINDPVQDGDVLTVIAEDGIAAAVFTVQLAAAPPGPKAWLDTQGWDSGSVPPSHTSSLIAPVSNGYLTVGLNVEDVSFDSASFDIIYPAALVSDPVFQDSDPAGVTRDISYSDAGDGLRQATVTFNGNISAGSEGSRILELKFDPLSEGTLPISLFDKGYPGRTCNLSLFSGATELNYTSKDFYDDPVLFAFTDKNSVDYYYDTFSQQPLVNGILYAVTPAGRQLMQMTPDQYGGYFFDYVDNDPQTFYELVIPGYDYQVISTDYSYSKNGIIPEYLYITGQPINMLAPTTNDVTIKFYAEGVASAADLSLRNIYYSTSDPGFLELTGKDFSFQAGPNANEFLLTINGGLQLIGDTDFQEYEFYISNSGILLGWIFAYVQDGYVLCTPDRIEAGYGGTPNITLTDQTNDFWAAGETNLNIILSEYVGASDVYEDIGSPIPAGSVTDTTLAFQLPAGLRSGDYQIKVNRGTEKIAQSNIQIIPAPPAPKVPKAWLSTDGRKSGEVFPTSWTMAPVSNGFLVVGLNVEDVSFDSASFAITYPAALVSDPTFWDPDPAGVTRSISYDDAGEGLRQATVTFNGNISAGSEGTRILALSFAPLSEGTMPISLFDKGDYAGQSCTLSLFSGDTEINYSGKEYNDDPVLFTFTDKDKIAYYADFFNQQPLVNGSLYAVTTAGRQSLPVTADQYGGYIFDYVDDDPQTVYELEIPGYDVQTISTTYQYTTHGISARHLVGSQMHMMAPTNNDVNIKFFADGVASAADLSLQNIYYSTPDSGFQELIGKTFSFQAGDNANEFRLIINGGLQLIGDTDSQEYEFYISNNGVLLGRTFTMVQRGYIPNVMSTPGSVEEGYAGTPDITLEELMMDDVWAAGETNLSIMLSEYVTASDDYEDTGNPIPASSVTDTTLVFQLPAGLSSRAYKFKVYRDTEQIAESNFSIALAPENELTPDTVDYDKSAATSDPVIGSSKAVTDVELAGETIGTENFSYAEGSLTLYQSYLNNLVPGTYVFSVKFDDQSTALLTVNVNDTAPAQVTGIAIKTAPAKVQYTPGEALDLSGLEVTLTKSDQSTVDIAFGDFDAQGITTAPSNGAVLQTPITQVTITHTQSGKSVDLPITVEALTYQLLLQTNPTAAGGTVTGAGNYPDGTQVTVTAVANDGYVFAHWSEDGSKLSNAASFSIDMSKNRTLVAHFAKNINEEVYIDFEQPVYTPGNLPEPWNVYTSGNGSVSVSGVGPYAGAQALDVVGSPGSGAGDEARAEYLFNTNPADGDFQVKARIRPAYHSPADNGAGYVTLGIFKITNNHRNTDFGINDYSAYKSELLVYFQMDKPYGVTYDPNSHLHLNVQNAYTALGGGTWDTGSVGSFVPGEYHYLTATWDYAENKINVVIERPDGATYQQTLNASGIPLHSMCLGGPDWGGAYWDTNPCRYDEIVLGPVTEQQPDPIVAAQFSLPGSLVKDEILVGDKWVSEIFQVPVTYQGYSNPTEQLTVQIRNRYPADPIDPLQLYLNNEGQLVADVPGLRVGFYEIVLLDKQTGDALDNRALHVDNPVIPVIYDERPEYSKYGSSVLKVWFEGSTGIKNFTSYTVKLVNPADQTDVMATASEVFWDPGMGGYLEATFLGTENIPVGEYNLRVEGPDSQVVECLYGSNVIFVTASPFIYPEVDPWAVNGRDPFTLTLSGQNLGSLSNLQLSLIEDDGTVVLSSASASVTQNNEDDTITATFAPDINTPLTEGWYGLKSNQAAEIASLQAAGVLVTSEPCVTGASIQYDNAEAPYLVIKGINFDEILTKYALSDVKAHMDRDGGFLAETPISSLTHDTVILNLNMDLLQNQINGHYQVGLLAENETNGLTWFARNANFMMDAAPAVVYGDLNGENGINSTDLGILKAYLLGKITAFPNGVPMEAADLNGVNGINSTDYGILKAYLLGKITVLPVENQTF